MDKMNPYYFEGVDYKKSWFRLRQVIAAQRESEILLDAETLWYVEAYMDLIENVKPLPRILYEPNDIPPRYVLQRDPSIDAESIALGFHAAAQRCQTIDGSETVGGEEP